MCLYNACHDRFVPTNSLPESVECEGCAPQIKIACCTTSDRCMELCLSIRIHFLCSQRKVDACAADAFASSETTGDWSSARQVPF